MGEATDSMVSLAAAKGMKVIKTGAIHHPKKYEECLPYCNPGDLNDYTNNLFPISSSCPKYLERFTDWGYKTDFEMEIDSQDLVSLNTGYAFRNQSNVSRPFSVNGADGYLSEVANHDSGYMFLGPVAGSGRQFSPNHLDSSWCRADFVMSCNFTGGDPDTTVVAKLVVSSPFWCRWCPPYSCEPSALCSPFPFPGCTTSCCPTSWYDSCIKVHGPLPPIDLIQKYDTTFYVQKGGGLIDTIPLKVDTIAYATTVPCGQATVNWKETLAWVRNVKISDFSASGILDTISVPYVQRINYPYVFQVYWTKQKDVFVDKIIVSNFPGRKLDSIATKPADPEYSSARANISAYYGSLSAPLERWYLLDEPYGGSAHSADNADDLVRSGSAVTRMFHVWNGGSAGPLAYGDFLLTADPPELHIDFFANLCNVDSTTFSNVNDTIDGRTSRQKNFNDYVSSLRAADSVALNFQKQFWVNVQIDRFVGAKEGGGYKEEQRDPTESEINATAFLALAYGAKGISYYMYSTSYHSDSCLQSPQANSTVEPGFKKFATDTSRGIMQPMFIDNPPSAPPCAEYANLQYGCYKFKGLVEWNNVSQKWVPNAKWFWVKSVNDKLKKIGPTLMTLTWQNAGPANSPPSIVSSVSSVQYPDIASAYVEVSWFKDAQNIDYIMLVNRRVLVQNSEAQDLTVRINKVGLYSITDLLTDSVLIAGNTCGTGFSYKVHLNPGEGKLFKLTPYTGNLHGLAAIDSVCTELTADGDVTVEVGRKMNFKAGGKLRFVANTDVLASGRSTSKGEFVVKGAVVATGSSSSPVEFKSSAASPGTQDWYGVRAEPGGSFKSTYGQFKNAYCALDYRNSAADVVQNCLFQDDFMYGVRDSANNNLAINYNKFSNLDTYGVYLELADATVYADTFTNIQMAINADRSYGSISNNVITTTGSYIAEFGFREEGAAGTQKVTFSGDSIAGIFNEAAVVANGGVAITNCKIYPKAPLEDWPDPPPQMIGILGTGTATATVRETTVKMFSSGVNATPAVKVIATPVLDLEACPVPCEGGPPNNRIFRVGNSAKALTNTTGATVLARNNWWGTASPCSSCIFSGNVAFRPYLTAPPAKLLAGDFDEPQPLPTRFALNQNYPNPFNPTTTISFALPMAERVRLEIFNILGQKVRTLVDGEKPAGIHNVIWDGTDDKGIGISSGIYLYKIETPTHKEVKRMTFLK